MINGFPHTPSGRRGVHLTASPIELADVETLDNGVRVIRCGVTREMIRTPAEIGVNACAILRRASGQLGDVIGDRDRHTYFAVPAKTNACWDALIQDAGLADVPLALLSTGAIVVLPAPDGGATGWLHGPTACHTTPAADVLAAIRRAASNSRRRYS